MVFKSLANLFCVVCGPIIDDNQLPIFIGLTEYTFDGFAHPVCSVIRGDNNGKFRCQSGPLIDKKSSANIVLYSIAPLEFKWAASPENSGAYRSGYSSGLLVFENKYPFGILLKRLGKFVFSKRRVGIKYNCTP